MAIKAVGAEQRHVGIVYKSDSFDERRLLELQCHHRLRSSALDESYLWAEPTIESEIAARMNRLCIAIARKYGRAGSSVA